MEPEPEIATLAEAAAQPEPILDRLTQVSQSFNIGYALGMTAREVEDLAPEAYARLIPLARETHEGVRTTPDHRRLASTPGRLRLCAWVARGRL